MSNFFSKYNKQPKYRICRNKFGYFKVQQETWLTLFGIWGKFFTHWRDHRGQQMYPRITPNVLRFNKRKEALDYIKGEQEKRRRSNDDWSCGQLFK